MHTCKRGDNNGVTCATILFKVGVADLLLTHAPRVAFFLGAVSRLRLRGFFEHALRRFGDEQFLFPLHPTPSFGCTTGARASRSSAPSRNPTLARIFLAWYRPRPVLSNLHTTLFVLFHFPLPSFPLFLHELATAKCMLHASQS